MAINRKLGVVLALVMAASMWFYIQRIMIVHQIQDAGQFEIPRGNLSDLYPRWLGARELLLHHRDPYSAEVTREIQAGYYGRPLDPARPHDPKDQQGFAYPVYVVFLLAPTVWLPFETVRILFFWFLVILTALSVLQWLGALGWHASFHVVAILIILTLGSFQVLQGIKLQQLSLLVAIFLAGCAWLLAQDHLLLAGIFLALATIKPQLVLPIAAWLLLWAVSDWHHRKKLALAFGITMAALIVASEFVLPGWPTEFRAAVAAYRVYNNGSPSILDLLITPTWGRLLAIVTLLGLAILGWRFRRADTDSVMFQFTMVFVLAVTVLITPKAALYNQVLLAPGIFFMLQHWQDLQRKTLTNYAVLAGGAFLAWPWLAALLLTVASLVLPAEAVQREWALPIYTSIAIPLWVVTVLACCAREITSPATTTNKPFLHEVVGPR